MAGPVYDLHDRQELGHPERPAPAVGHRRDERRQQEQERQVKQDEELRREGVDGKVVVKAGEEVLDDMEELSDNEAGVEVTTRTEMVMVYDYISFGHAEPPSP